MVLFVYSNVIAANTEFELPMEVRFIRTFGDNETSAPIIILDPNNPFNSSVSSVTNRQVATSIQNKYVNIELDLFSTKSPSLYAKFIHCNFDWTESDNVFLNDVTNRTSNIEIRNAPVYSDYFTHRATLQVPNSQIKFRFAGNWKVVFYDYDTDEKIAEARFFVVNPLVSTELQVYTDLYRSDFKVTSTSFIFDAVINSNSNSNLFDNQLNSAVFYTNNRWFEPYFVTNSHILNSEFNQNNKYRYNYTASNRGFLSMGRTFRISGIPAENCYRTIDFSNTTQYPRLLSGSTQITFPDLIRNGSCDNYDNDGALLQGFSQPDIDDYVNVEFVLDPMINKSKDLVFLSGSFNNFHPTKDWIMHYDESDKRYKLRQWVRRGKHDYLYATGELNVDNNYVTKLSYDYFEGNTAYSNHTYYVFVYYREIDNGGYDSIVGVAYKKGI